MGFTADGLGGVSFSILVKMDPRVKASTDDLRRHFDLDQKIAETLHKDYAALQQVRSLRAQIKALSGVPDSTKKTASDLDAKAAAIEGDEGGYGTRYMSTPEGRSLARLNVGFNALVSALDTADDAPTAQQSAMFGELDQALAEQLSAWGQLASKDVPELNDQLKKAGLPSVDLQKPVPGAADAARTTSQERDRNEE